MVFKPKFWAAWFKKQETGFSAETVDLSAFLSSPEHEQYKALSNARLVELIGSRSSFTLRWLGCPMLVTCVLMKNSVAFCLHGTEAGSEMSLCFEQIFGDCKVQRYGPVVGAWSGERGLDVAGLLMRMVDGIPHEKNDHLMFAKTDRNISHLSG